MNVKRHFSGGKKLKVLLMIHFLCFAALPFFYTFDPVQHFNSLVPALYRLWLDSLA